MLINEKEREVQYILNAAVDLLPQDQLSEMMDLVLAGEPGIALENCCTQLYEYDVTVPPNLLHRIVKIGTAMNLDPSYWEPFMRK